MSMDYEPLACDALRQLLIYTMKHNLPALRALLADEFEFLHVRDDFFPESYEEWRHTRPRSLLGIALFDAEAPEAVKMLLAHGADPNGELWVSGHCYDPSRGLPAYAVYLARKRQDMDKSTRLACLRALLDGGGDAIEGAIAFGDLQGDWTAEVDLCHSYFDEQQAAMRAEMRRLWRVPLLLGTIVGYWEHVAAAPGSKAAQAARMNFEGSVAGRG